MAFLSRITVPPTYQDGFGRLRVSNPYALHDFNFYTSARPEAWDQLTQGGGTINYTPNFPTVNIVSSGAISKAVRQSRMYVPYQPGKSQLSFLSGILELNGGVAGTTARIGIFDDQADKTINVTPGNGFFFQLSGTNLSVVQRSGVTGIQSDTVVPQASWNQDPLDGTGKSGITLDPGHRQIFYIEVEWLGSGSVVMGVIIQRSFVPCHIFYHANLPGNSAYTNRGSLPVRYELSSDGTGGGAEMRQICSTVISEGLSSLETPLSRSLGISRGATGVTATAAAEPPLLSLRLKNSRNRASASLKSLSVLCSTNGNILIRIYRFISPEAYGPGPLTGASWTDTNSSTVPLFAQMSVTEYDMSATAVDLTNTVYPFLALNPKYFSTDLDAVDVVLEDDAGSTLQASIQGYPDWYIITVSRAQGGTGSETVVGGITWVEIE